MVTQIPNIINELPSNDKFNFESQSLVNFVRISPDSIRDKFSLHEYYFKKNIIQHYLIPDREIPMTVVVRGLSRSLDMDLEKETKTCRGFTVLKYLR